ncbi:MAG: ABC transporter ATP-binding protein [Ferrimicrobium sp.]
MVEQLLLDSRADRLGASMGSGETRVGVAVELEGVSKYYSNVAALDTFTLTANPGELVVLLGPSGCGKTTALRSLAGLENFDAGTIRIGGKDVSQLPAAKRNIGMVFQNYSLFPNMTAKVNVEFGLRVRRWSGPKRAKRALELLELVGLSAQADRFPHQLSGGQQQRIALARALAIEPEVLLLDEPLSALDAKVRAQLREEIRRIQLELGITTFFVTHDQDEALAIADRIAVMEGGRLAQFGTPLEVYASPTSEFVAEFVGSVNRLSGVVESERAVQVEGIGSIPYDAHALGFRIGDRVDVLIRPEAIGVEPSAEGKSEILTQSFLGSSVKVSIRTDLGRMVISVLSMAEAQVIVGVSRVRLFAKGPALLLASATSQLGVVATPDGRVMAVDD